jgi:hypothetical protein
MSWTTNLAKPLKPRDHAERVTLGHARDYMLKLPDEMASRQVWLRAGDFLLAAAAEPTEAAIDEVTGQLDLALFTTYRLSF